MDNCTEKVEGDLYGNYWRLLRQATIIFFASPVLLVGDLWMSFSQMELGFFGSS